MSETSDPADLEPIDFMREGRENRIKREISELYTSYDNPWDILAELAQNSVDAVKQWNDQYRDSEEPRDHEIHVTINKEANQVKIKDTGIGIHPTDVPGLLAPHGTDKADDSLTIGEKGVGLTFCIFSSNHFEIDTTSVNGHFQGTISGARDWWQDGQSQPPMAEPEEKTEESVSPIETGTEIRLADLELTEYPDNQTLFDLNVERIVYLIRTKTALGYIRSALRGEEREEDPNISVYLTITDEDNTILNSEQIDFQYKFPHEFFDESETVSIDDIRADLPLDDDQKSERLHMKNIKVTGKEQRTQGRIVRYYAFYMPGADWEKLSKQNDLVGDPDEIHDVDGGIYIATRGMPTGVKLEPPKTGFPGYWSGIYMILEYDEIPFDLGRKSLTGRRGMLRDVAYNVFNEELLPFMTYIRRAPPTSPTDLFRDRIGRFNDLKRLPNLDYDGISFQKEPDGQEAGVVSIFHELIGEGLLKYYQGLRAGYKQDYDFWGEYRITESDLGAKVDIDDFHEDNVGRDPNSGTKYITENVVIEYKYECAEILSDFENKRKEFDAIDIIVCWQLSEAKMSNMTVSPLNPKNAKYAGCNYKIIVPNNSVISNQTKYVIELKSLLEAL